MLAATVAAVTHKRVAGARRLASVVPGARELEQRRRADDDESADARLARLTAALRGRMLRRTKADVLRRALPGKRELAVVVRVAALAPQKALYRAVLTKNYDALAAEDRGRGGGAPPNLQNVVIQLRKMTKMLDVLGEYCALRQFAYERLDGDTAARDRARRIDRFNAAAADRAFLFLLSTLRASA
ncbi:hypothetical protein SO694_00019357 [Aureococcus anophagefferens]|uniref:SNF2 N-terminal domain-containing protein n=1 Tax=Aureococcus anophagefferens TaxID=44056 RepID=A0ABR1G036_AURAN